jgi:hypothetical protein
MGCLGFLPTGQCFGACFSPPNFDQGAKGRQEQAGFLWEFEPERTLERAVVEWFLMNQNQQNHLNWQQKTV